MYEIIFLTIFNINWKILIDFDFSVGRMNWSESKIWTTILLYDQIFDNMFWLTAGCRSNRLSLVDYVKVKCTNLKWSAQISSELLKSQVKCSNLKWSAQIQISFQVLLFFSLQKFYNDLNFPKCEKKKKKLLNACLHV